jgi:putative oxidoreductase
MTMSQSPFDTTASSATLLIRLSVGAVFLSEGIQKFLFPVDVGAGRFERIGIPAPEVLGPLVGVTEIACGILLLLGLFTRLAALPIIGVMLVAILTTKIPILLGQDLGPFQVRTLQRYGFWSMAHESRTDFAMLMGSLFLAWVGGGRWSLDQIRRRAHATAGREQDHNSGGRTPAAGK